MFLKNLIRGELRLLGRYNRAPIGLAPLQTSLCLSSGLGGCLSDDVGLVDGSLDHLLFVGVEVLCEVFIERRLFLL
jgi:hypothetical protein